MRWIEDTGPLEDIQDEGRYEDPRVGHRHRDDRPIADVLEQEVPVDGTDESPVGRDDDRVESNDPSDWYETEVVEADPEEAWGTPSG